MPHCLAVAVAVALCCMAVQWTLVSTEAVFSNDEIQQTTPSVVSLVSGASVAECVLKCELQFLKWCSAAAFVPAEKQCVLADIANAALPSAESGGLTVFRKQQQKAFQFAQLHGRSFQVIQHRSKGNLSFSRRWTEHEDGFRDDTDFWIGLQKINQLTGSSSKLLRVEAVTWSNALYISEYSGFSVGDATTNYTMTYGSYLSTSSNTTSDSLADNNGMPFSTIDRDTANGCSAIRGSAGWWFKSCTKSNPNGLYYDSAVTNLNSMHWFGATSQLPISLKSIQLMLELA